MLLVSVLWEVSAFLCSQLFISLVMKRGSGPDRIKSSWSLCCSCSHCSQRIWSVLNCRGVWLFWSVSANRGCFWQGCTWVIASKHWKDVLCCIAGHETAYFHHHPLPVPFHLGDMLICSNKSSLCYLTWLTSQCKYDRCLPQQLPAFQKWVGSACEILHSWIPAVRVCPGTQAVGISFSF